MSQVVAVVGTWTVVRLEGRIEGQTAPAVEAELRPLIVSSSVRLALDLSQVDYVSSAGLRVFLSLFRECQAQPDRFILVAPKAAVREVLDISGFSTILTLVDSEEALPA
jgi:anti-anti-sigma factor